jgi:hypothetical protein
MDHKIQTALLIGLLSISLATLAMILFLRPAPVADSTRWEYAEFEFDKPSHPGGADNQPVNACLIFYNRSETNEFELVKSEPQRMIDTAEVLSAIGQDGWEFVWTDGARFVVRRHSGQGQHFRFSVQYLPAEKSNATNQ